MTIELSNRTLLAVFRSAPRENIGYQVLFVNKPFYRICPCRRISALSVGANTFMPGTGLGIFWVDFMCKPFFKGMLKQPELVVLFICLIYGYIAYKLVKSAYLSDQN